MVALRAMAHTLSRLIPPSAPRTPQFLPVPAPANANIARHLSLMAAQAPARVALKVPRGRDASGRIDYLSLTFAELDAEVAAWREHLTRAGVRRGDRTLVMVKQGLPLIAAAFALFQLGAVPVIIDPGMGLKNFLRCVGRSRPRVLLGIPLAQAVSRVFRRAFSSVDVRVRASSSPVAQRVSSSWRSKEAVSSRSDEALAVSVPTDLAAILFTSGSTGAPKGVCYEHGMFEAQVRMIREAYRIEPGEVDLPMLPIFALFNPALGLTTIVPEIDPRKPASVDPRKIVQAIQQEGVTNSFGSPTLWQKIGAHCGQRRVTLPSLRRVLCAGAPVPMALWDSSRQWMPNGTLHSPYGATEALPVSTVSAPKVLSFAQDTVAALQGACVGRPLPDVSVKVIAIEDRPIATLDAAREAAPGTIGEIVVAGPMATRSYDALPDATAGAKISEPCADGATRIWHRMGDCGFIDAEGRLWFCGRKAERVETANGPMFTEPCERVFRLHPRVTRCALVGLGRAGAQVPALIVEASPPAAERATFAAELRALGRGHAATRGITTFFFHSKFPVDVRHNAKIHRLTLARWAENAKPERVP